MLEHQKIVLKGVREDKTLFRKELIKSLEWLSEQDLTQFKIWVHENFFHEHPDIIHEVLLSSKFNVAS